MKFIGDFDATLEDYITSLPAVTSIGTGILSVTASDITLYDATNNGNPTVKIGSSATECLEILSQYESGAQGLDVVKFTTKTAGSATNDGRFAFYPDEELTFQIRDHGINLATSKSLQINSVDIISDYVSGYAGIWGSPAGNTDGNLELDYYGGFSGPVPGLEDFISWDGGVLYYDYPGLSSEVAAQEINNMIDEKWGINRFYDENGEFDGSALLRRTFDTFLISSLIGGGIGLLGGLL